MFNRNNFFNNKFEKYNTYWTIFPGLKSKLFLTISNSSCSDLVDDPYENIVIDNGWAIPIAYEICTKTRLHKPALTNDLATHLAAYAALRSTFV